MNNLYIWELKKENDRHQYKMLKTNEVYTGVNRI